MKTSLRVSALVDWATVPDDDPAFEKTPEKPGAEYHVVQALRSLGHRVAIVSVHDNAGQILTDLAAQTPDIIFNLTETFRAERRLDKNIAALLELTGIPFTGTGSTGLMLCRDKGLCKQLLALHRVRVPGFVMAPLRAAVRVPRGLRFPMVVKPMFADGSEGISRASLVATEEALRERVAFVHEHWKQTAIAEEYIDGRELYIGMLGNLRPKVLPGRELFFNRAEDGNGPVLATYRVKWDEKYQEKWQIRFGFAELEAKVAAKIARVCRRVYRLLQLRDFARIDMRLTADGQIVIIEANPNPDISRGEEVAESARVSGIGYEDLLDRILSSALLRFDGRP